MGIAREPKVTARRCECWILFPDPATCRLERSRHSFHQTAPSFACRSRRACPERSRGHLYTRDVPDPDPRSSKQCGPLSNYCHPEPSRGICCSSRGTKRPPAQSCGYATTPAPTIFLSPESCTSTATFKFGVFHSLCRANSTVFSKPPSLTSPTIRNCRTTAA